MLLLFGLFNGYVQFERFLAAAGVALELRELQGVHVVVLNAFFVCFYFLFVLF